MVLFILITDEHYDSFLINESNLFVISIYKNNIQIQVVHTFRVWDVEQCDRLKKKIKVP